MQKTVIAPIVGVLVLALQLAFGVQLPEDVVNAIIVYVGNGVALATVVYGIFANHKKKKLEE